MAHDGEWLQKIDVNTSLEEVVERPSPFNPYPEHAQDGIEVWDEGLRDDKRPVIRYTGLDQACRVTLPVGVAPHDRPASPPALQRTSSLIGSGHLATSHTIGMWVPLHDYWENSVAPPLATDYLFKEGHGQDATRIVSELMESCAFPPSIYSEILAPEPRAFVRKAVAKVQELALEGSPAAAMVLATSIFEATSDELPSGRFISNSATKDWAHDGLPRLLFPTFAPAWDIALPARAHNTVAHPEAVGESASTIISRSLSGMAIAAWLRTAPHSAKQPVINKVAALHRMEARNVDIIAAELRVKLQEASNRLFEATVKSDSRQHINIPRQLSRYVMRVATSIL